MEPRRQTGVIFCTTITNYILKLLDKLSITGLYRKPITGLRYFYDSYGRCTTDLLDPNFNLTVRNPTFGIFTTRKLIATR